MPATPIRRTVGRRKKGRAIDGVVLLDKAYGVSSNRALQQVRRAFDARKAGHTGSLDPLATGLLPICFGEATKLSSYLLSADKRYRVTASLAGETATGDLEGEIIATSDAEMPSDEALVCRLANFIGRQQQIPPMYSALKVNGRPLYAYARAGGTVERASRTIHVHDIQLVAAQAGAFTLDVAVSGGTYVRTLVEDIARSWGGRAHVSALRRTAVGPLGQETGLAMITQEAIDEISSDAERPDWLLPVSRLVAHWPTAVLDVDQSRRMSQGQSLAAADWPAGDAIRLIDASGRMIGLGHRESEGSLRPLRLFARPVD